MVMARVHEFLDDERGIEYHRLGRPPRMRKIMFVHESPSFLLMKCRMHQTKQHSACESLVRWEVLTSGTVAYCRGTFGKTHMLRDPAAPVSGDREVYSGMFGPWSVEESDITEVTIYRVGLSIAAAGAGMADVPPLTFIPLM